MKYEVFAEKVTNELENLRLSERVKGQSASKKQPLSSIATFGIQQQSRQSTSKNASCRLCQEKHPWFKCSTFVNPERKRRRAVSLGLCLQCLRSDHAAEQGPGITHFKCIKPSCSVPGIHNYQLCETSPLRVKIISENSKLQNYHTSVNPVW